MRLDRSTTIKEPRATQALTTSCSIWALTVGVSSSYGRVSKDDVERLIWRLSEHLFDR